MTISLPALADPNLLSEQCLALIQSPPSNLPQNLDVAGDLSLMRPIWRSQHGHHHLDASSSDLSLMKPIWRSQLGYQHSNTSSTYPCEGTSNQSKISQELSPSSSHDHNMAPYCTHRATSKSCASHGEAIPLLDMSQGTTTFDNRAEDWSALYQASPSVGQASALAALPSRRQLKKRGARVNNANSQWDFDIEAAIPLSNIANRSDRRRSSSLPTHLRSASANLTFSKRLPLHLTHFPETLHFKQRDSTRSRRQLDRSKRPTARAESPHLLRCPPLRTPESCRKEAFLSLTLGIACAMVPGLIWCYYKGWMDKTMATLSGGDFVECRAHDKIKLYKISVFFWMIFFCLAVVVALGFAVHH